MKKQILKRGLWGFPIGIAIGHGISILISLLIGQGQFIATPPTLVEQFGSELNAVIIQSLLGGMLGAGFSITSIIWELDNWSIAKQSCVHFAILSTVMLPIAYCLHWMEHSLLGFTTYFAIFIIIYIAIWFAIYLSWKIKIKQLNDGLKSNKNH
ncbi:MAG: DUF3021 domain-containing protein [Eubacteriales bacterium]|nr:DUF3021 domain-containing protein [Eubacteriales bacterium]